MISAATDLLDFWHTRFLCITVSSNLDMAPQWMQHQRLITMKNLLSPLFHYRDLILIDYRTNVGLSLDESRNGVSHCEAHYHQKN